VDSQLRSDDNYLAANENYHQYALNELRPESLGNVY